MEQATASEVGLASTTASDGGGGTTFLGESGDRQDRCALVFGLVFVLLPMLLFFLFFSFFLRSGAV